MKMSFRIWPTNHRDVLLSIHIHDCFLISFQDPFGTVSSITQLDNKTAVGMVILGMSRMLKIEWHELLLERTWVLFSISTWGTSQTLVTLAAEDLAPSSDPLRNCTHMNTDIDSHSFSPSLCLSASLCVSLSLPLTHSAHTINKIF